MPDQISRRQLLSRAAVVGAGTLAGGGWLLDRALRDPGATPAGPVVGTAVVGSNPPAARTTGTAASRAAGTASSFSGGQHFVSRPDLQPPAMAVSRHAPNMREGLIFMAPYAGPGEYGPMIVRRSGELVYFNPVHPLTAANFRVQHLHGERVITWWEGQITPLGHGLGEYVIADERYGEVKRVQPANGLQGDLHEFLLTPQGTALFTIFHEIPADLRPIGGPQYGRAVESIVQEVDVDSGKLLLQWNSIDHIPLTESYQSEYDPYDFVHANSIDIDHDGHLLISARNTWTIYKVHRHTGAILWRLGGKRSDFTISAGARFLWQHDFRRHLNGLYSVFDNGSSGSPGPHQSRSRGLMLHLDETAMTASLARQYLHPGNSLAASQGNLQLLPDGNVFIGWGSLPYVSEFRPRGGLRYNASLPSGGQSYRAFRDPWVAQPMRQPAVAVRRTSDGGATVYASWNGATEVAAWKVLVGSGDNLYAIASAPSSGFETAIAIRLPARTQLRLAVQALDVNGRALAASAALRV